MKHSSFFHIGLFSAAMVITSASALAEAPDYGKHLYDANCASCHGPSGKGDGPLKPYLSVRPTDLTTIAKNNNGVLPAERLAEVIDGRKGVGAHGVRDMPVWGRDFSTKVGKEWAVNMDLPYNSETFVRGRIMALVDYINRMQAK